jgi:two-component system chemotaxis family response regulator WspR
LLILKPIQTGIDSAAQYYATYWRSTASGASAADSDIQQALLKAKRRIRDLSRDDPVTGLLNEGSFREVLAHDWSVAAREKANLALISFSLNDFSEYLEIFGRHAADSCLRRVAQAVRRCLRRASDVAARVDVDNNTCIVVLSHSPSDVGVADFAARISAAVRELGLHHPRSSESKFVTVSYKTNVVAASEGKASEAKFLQDVLP